MITTSSNENLTHEISEREIVARHTAAQRVGGWETRGGMADQERRVNGPVRVHRMSVRKFPWKSDE